MFDLRLTAVIVAALAATGCSPDSTTLTPADASLSIDATLDATLDAALDDAFDATADAAGNDATKRGHDADACGADTCPQAACTGRKDGAPCDDGDGCTVSDACVAGVCTSGADICACHTTKDCAKRQAELDKVAGLCAPTLYCDIAQLPHKCVQNPGTIIDCPTSADTTCQINTCVPKTGECALLPIPATPCDDGDPCTAGDMCDATGSCATGTTFICACKTDGDCANKDDGDACNGTLYCDLSGAKPACSVNPATVIDCPASLQGPCKINVCAPTTGKCADQNAPGGTPCDDGLICTGGEVCEGGACTIGPPICPCTEQSDCITKDDGDLCNGTLYCDKTIGHCKPNLATVVACPTVDDTACVHNTCGAKTGTCAATVVNETGVCSDGVACTDGDHCVGGACKAGADICPCKTDQDCVGKDDGDICNGTLYCAKAGAGSVCKLNPATQLHCATVDDTACVANLYQLKNRLAK